MSAAAAKMHSKNVPIFKVGDCGLSAELLQYHMNRLVPALISETATIQKGFQSLVSYNRGILLVAIDNRKALTDFAGEFQHSIKKMNLSGIKIAIFSTKQEILNSRTLTQFPFIRIVSPQLGVKRVATLLSRDFRDLEAKTGAKAKPTPKDNKLADILVIKGSILDASAAYSPQAIKLKVLEPKVGMPVTPPLSQCVGSAIPSFIYNKDLSWRVRGYFSSYNEKKAMVTFRAHREDGARLLQQELKGKLQLLSSSSSPEARICCTLNFVEQHGLDFIFQAPRSVHEVQRRTLQRVRITEDSPVLIQFFDKTEGSDIALSVNDISAGGLGVRIDKDLVPNYNTGEVIQNISLIFSQRVVKVPGAEVRHCSPSDANPDFRVLGLQFQGVSKADMEFIEIYALSKSMLEGKTRN